MLVTFQSKSSADVRMFEEHAKFILDILNKNVTRGIITVAELESAIAKLQGFCDSKRPSEDEKAQHETELPGDDPKDEQSEQVSTVTRVYPLLEMLRTSQREGSDVMWGVEG